MKECSRNSRRESVHTERAESRKMIGPGQAKDTSAACALPYAGVFITDGEKASAIRELKLDATYTYKEKCAP